jgi:uncharacterized protein YecE (DUF72 family)
MALLGARGIVRIGTSGWLYPRWRGTFYPPGLPHRRELEFASRPMSTVEINGSFYSLLRPECWQAWYAQTPADFPAFVRLLREHDVALCVADTAGRWPILEAVTSDFVYVRLHGAEELYVSGYGPRALERWARQGADA